MPSSVFEKVLLMYARRFPIRRGKMRVVDRLWQMGLSGRSTHRVATLKHGKFKMSCDLSEMLQRQFYFFGTYLLEEDLLRCWVALSKGAKFIFDVGSNAGIYSLAAIAVQPDVVVHAFEPTPEIAARLRATAELNHLGNLYVHEAAVLGENGHALLNRYRGELGNNEGMNFVTESSSQSDAERVTTVSLDQFCRGRSIDFIDLLKLDVQGHEYSALRGAQHLIRAGRVGTIFMELNWWAKAGGQSPADESVRLLGEAGFLFSKPGTLLKWEKAGDWLRGLGDIVARHVRA